VELLIVARDGGIPPLSAEVTMNVEITQTINEYPQWVADYSSAPPIRIPESVPVNFEVGRFRATSTVPDGSLNYFIARGDTPEQNGAPISFYSRLDERSGEMVLLTYRPLDYETLSSYTLTIKAAVSVNITCHFRCFSATLLSPRHSKCKRGLYETAMSFSLSVRFLFIFFICCCLDGVRV